VATPFVQGRLRQEPLSVAITTQCAHCGRPLHMTIDSDLHYQVDEVDAEPLVFQPLIDWTAFTEPTIIDAF
jgi:hypothetical protein